MTLVASWLMVSSKPLLKSDRGILCEMILFKSRMPAAAREMLFLQDMVLYPCLLYTSRCV